MNKFLKNKAVQLGAAGSAFFGATAANASVITTEVQAALDGINGDIVVVGSIIIGVAATYAAFKWVKRATGM